MKQRLISIAKYVIGWPLSILAFLFIGKLVWDQGPTLLPNLVNLNWTLLGFGCLSFLIYYFLRSVIWYRIMKLSNSTVTLRESTYLWAMSEVKRYIPGKVWMVLGRTMMFEKHGVEKKEIGKSLLLELEVFGIGSVVVATLALLFFFPEQGWLYLLLAFIVVALLIGIYIFNRDVLHFLHIKAGKFAKFTHILLPPFKPQETLLLLSFSVTSLFFFGLGNYLVISSAVYLDPNQLFPLIGVFVLAFLSGFLSVIAPSGLGVREGVVLYGLLQLTTSGLAAFGALFSRIILVLSELIFIVIASILRSLKEGRVLRFFVLIPKHPQFVFVLLLSSLYTIYISATSFLRHEQYYTGRFDLGNMDQTVWNTLHGNFFLFTNPDGTEIISRLATHADFILILLAPFYLIWEDPRMLLLIQTVIIAAGALFVYAIARDVLKNKYFGILFAFAYLINPSIERANLYDFHAVTLATTFFLGAYYFLRKKQLVWFVLFCLLAALTKEQVWLTFALFGGLAIVWYRQYLLGGVMMLMGAGLFYYLVSYAIPNANPESQHFAISYFAAFGNTPAEILTTIVFSPWKVFEAIGTPSHIDYYHQIFMPYGYLTFLYPFLMIFAGPDLGINLLSSNEQLHEIYYQYTATVSPFIILSAIYGVWVLKRFVIPKSHQIVGLYVVGLYLLAISVYAAYLYGPLPGARWANTDMYTKPLENKAFVDAYLANIPREHKVAASNSLGAHLMYRDYIYTVPIGIDRADTIVLLLNNEKSRDTYEIVKQDSSYREVARDGDFVAFERIEKASY